MEELVMYSGTVSAMTEEEIKEKKERLYNIILANVYTYSKLKWYNVFKKPALLNEIKYDSLKAGNLEDVLLKQYGGKIK